MGSLYSSVSVWMMNKYSNSTMYRRLSCRCSVFCHSHYVEITSTFHSFVNVSQKLLITLPNTLPSKGSGGDEIALPDDVSSSRRLVFSFNSNSFLPRPLPFRLFKAVLFTFTNFHIQTAEYCKRMILQGIFWFLQWCVVG